MTTTTGIKFPHVPRAPPPRCIQ
jgi:hypothetical protein